MGMTQTQKILAAHAGLAEVKAGQLINAKLDIVLGNDITTPVAINELYLYQADAGASLESYLLVRRDRARQAHRRRIRRQRTPGRRRPSSKSCWRRATGRRWTPD
mgnify:CR=1 FL=1